MGGRMDEMLRTDSAIKTTMRTTATEILCKCYHSIVRERASGGIQSTTHKK